MTAEQCLASSRPILLYEQRGLRTWAYGLCRALVLSTLFSIIFLPEFAHTSGDTLSPLYDKAAGSFRYIDLLVLVAAFAHAVALGCLRRKRRQFPRMLALPGLAFLGCIALAIWYGARHGGSNFCFDWRGLALGIALYFVWSFWLQDASHAAAALRVFLVYAGIRIAILYALYFLGRPDTLLGVSIPTFDGPTLSCIAFTGILAFAYQQKARSLAPKLFCTGLALAAYLLVLLCLRRTYWGELALGTLLLLMLERRQRARSFVFAGTAVLIAAIILGSSFSGRVRSLDVSRDEGEFSADNADHVYDLMDAWYEIRQSPVMGIGLGTSYPTWYIRNWKPDSVMVHNAPLHVWLKYGLAGVACYLWFHIAWLTWLYRRARAPNSGNPMFLRAAFAYVAAQFAMTLGFAPWPYSELQMTALLSFLVAAAIAVDCSRSFCAASTAPLVADNHVAFGSDETGG